jgi:hypothetical protein
MTTWPGNGDPMPQDVIDAYADMGITLEMLNAPVCWGCGAQTRVIPADAQGRRPALKYAPYCVACATVHRQEGMAQIVETLKDAPETDQAATDDLMRDPCCPDDVRCDAAALIEEMENDA